MAHGNDPAGSDALSTLSQAYADLRSMRFPTGGAAAEIEEADVDLAEEAAFLAGLVETYLTTGRTGQPTLTLSRSIDHRLSRGLDGPDAVAAAAFVEYRRRMVKVAELLCRTAGVTLVWGE
jgi:hypothetical protein